PSGASLCGEWTLPEIRRNYGSVCVLKNERGLPELGFSDLDAAAVYAKKFCSISMLLQHNEDKVAMQLLADILSCAIKYGYADEFDFYSMSEQELISKFEDYADMDIDSEFSRLFRTFRTMKRVEHTDVPLENAYCVSLEVKKRYVDPLVGLPGKDCQRVSSLSSEISECLHDFVKYQDSKYGCVRLA
nr:hypothetical protein [Treponema sp.]